MCHCIKPLRAKAHVLAVINHGNDFRVLKSTPAYQAYEARKLRHMCRLNYRLHGRNALEIAEGVKAES
jgi:hypothetical protein